MCVCVCVFWFKRYRFLFDIYIYIPKISFKEKKQKEPFLLSGCDVWIICITKNTKYLTHVTRNTAYSLYDRVLMSWSKKHAIYYILLNSNRLCFFFSLICFPHMLRISLSSATLRTVPFSAPLYTHTQYPYKFSHGQFIPLYIINSRVYLLNGATISSHMRNKYSSFTLYTRAHMRARKKKKWCRLEIYIIRYFRWADLSYMFFLFLCV